ncbi:MAG: universal stress protein [Kofleriaceae bacterium]
MFKRILCPTDFSDGAKHAVAVAGRLAKASNAELVLLHAWYTPPILYAGDQAIPAAAIEAMMSGDEHVLADTLQELARLEIRVSTRFVRGQPGDQIVKILQEDPLYDLVVMGTTGRAGFSRILLGSVTEKVVRNAPCSVLAVRGTEVDRPFARVLCPVDFAEHSKYALRLAGELASREHEPVVALLHVVDMPSHYSTEPFLSEYMRSIDTLATQLLADSTKPLRENHHVATTATLAVGSPIPNILAALETNPSYDLVVVGSHGRHGLARMFLGSVAEKVVRHANTPVLVARAPRS